MKKKLIQTICLVILIFATFCNTNLQTFAITNKINSNNVDDTNKITYNKCEYTEEERDIIVNDAMQKIENNTTLSDEEISAINWEYEELSLTLPKDEFEFDGIQNDGIMLTGAVVGTSLIRGAATIVDNVGSIPTTLYDNGKGGQYNFNTSASSRFTMPGLKKTTVGNVQCDDMVPQGICVYNGYIFMSSYCFGKKHSSVVYVLNASTKAYITTLITGNKSHAGGIEILNGYLWLGHTDDNGNGYLYYYNASQIIDAIQFALTDTTVTAIDMTKFTNGKIQLDSWTKASYVTKYNGYLCVGEYYKSDNVGRLNLYTTTNLLNGNTTENTVGTVLANTNGVLFFTNGSNKYMIVNANYGNEKPSYVHVYSLNNTSSSTLKTTFIKSIEMPCMIEESMIYGSYTYFVFESGANAYKTLPNIESVIGKVCGFSTSFIYN